MRSPLETQALVALQTSRRHQMSNWEHLLNQHKRHASFRPETWVRSLEWGFSCSCSGDCQDWRIPVRSLRDQIPEVLETMRRLFAQHRTFKKPQKDRSAERRAKVLLHQFLTKQQRLELKKTDAFTMVAADGKTYRINKSMGNN